MSPRNTHPNSRYQDPIWSVAPLIDNPSASLGKIYWKNRPGEASDPIPAVAEHCLALRE
ncbi:hypothetical protein AB0N07_48330 [Streptomyces sp. NPDC051172]|uniref:hypothetical protein n=1 Tax=Streptomyces sp. NPDC051172 TaxID=3155796 RepID=UPI003417F759